MIFLLLECQIMKKSIDWGANPIFLFIRPATPPIDTSPELSTEHLVIMTKSSLEIEIEFFAEITQLFFHFSSFFVLCAVITDQMSVPLDLQKR